jgi:cysteine-rich repeat protein
MEMRQSLKALVLIVAAFGLSSSAHASDIRHTYAGNPLNSFYIDDAGGSVHNGGSDNSYFLNLLDIDQSAFGTLFLYAKNGNQTTVDDGLVDQDFKNGSGIQIFPLSSLPMSSSPGEIGLASDSPLTPVTFDATQSGLIVEQVSYTSDNPADKFVIVEYRVTNPTKGSIDARIALSNDFDVDLKSDDAKAGFDNTVAPMVYQQETPPIDPNNTTVGVSLTRGSLAQYRLEVCNGAFGPCMIYADDNDLIRKSFFENVGDQVGDLTGGIPNQDFAVTISALLGPLAPGESASVVFCYNLGQGNTSNEGLTDCENAANNCSNFYDTQIDHCGNGLVNFGENCDDGNDNQSDACPDGPNGSCQNAVCGDGFVWNTNGGTEQCDNGGANSDSASNACRTNCQNPKCGDGVTDAGEQCDDHNGSNTDSCLNTCLSAKCGDGFVHQGVEFCDDGNNINGDGCSADCQSFESCGNGVLDPGESCDDGNNNTSDGCPDGTHGICQPATCGDGFLWNTNGGTEQCDDGNKINGDGCSSTCQKEGVSSSVSPPLPPPICGDGHVDSILGEQCDDGNTDDFDGCDSQCHWEILLEGSGGANAPNENSSSCHLNSGANSAGAWTVFPLVAGILLLGGLRRQRRGGIKGLS